MIRVLKVIHYFICVFGYFSRGPNSPLSCNNPPNGQISPHGDTKQMRPRPSFRRPQHTPTSLYFHDSSSQSHPSLHMYVWLPLPRLGLRCTSIAVFSITATTRPHVLNVARLRALLTDAPPHRQVLIELAEPHQLIVLFITFACGRDEHPEFNVPGDERYRIRGVSLRRHQLPKIDDGQDSCTLQGGAASVDDAREN